MFKQYRRRKRQFFPNKPKKNVTFATAGTAMMSTWKFGCIGVSQTEAAVSFRERFALSDEKALRLLSLLREEAFPSQHTEAAQPEDLLILSTCHRTELYYGSETPKQNIRPETFVKWLCIVKGLPYDKNYLKSFFHIQETAIAVERLFRVGMGLQSQVLGDKQVIGQVKNAYRLSVQTETAGPRLHRLLHNIFYTHKQVAQETNFHKGTASIACAAVQRLQPILSQKQVQILVAGLGEVGEELCRRLSHMGCKNVFLANRTFKKTQQMAAQHHFTALSLGEAQDKVKDIDVLISCLRNQPSFWQKTHFSSTCPSKFRYLVDLSVPRNINTEVGELPTCCSTT